MTIVIVVLVLIQTVVTLVAVLAGWFLRDLQVEAIQKKSQELRKKPLSGKAETLEWTPPKSSGEEAEEQAKKDLS